MWHLKVATAAIGLSALILLAAHVARESYQALAEPMGDGDAPTAYIFFFGVLEEVGLIEEGRSPEFR